MRRPASAGRLLLWATMRIEGKTLAGIALGIAAALALFLAYEGTRHFPAGELDRKPYPMRRIDLGFPPGEKGIEYYGKLRMNVYIDSRGRVERVEVLDSRVPARLRDIAVNAFTRMAWEPGRKWGIRVKSVKEVEIDFEPPPGARERPVTQPDL
jgi:hypothetical protein